MSDSLKDYLNKARVISSERKYWLIRAYSGQLFDEYYDKDYVAIGMNSVPRKLIENARLNNSSATRSLKKFIRDNFQMDKSSSSRWANQLIDFEHSIKKNDMVLMPSKDFDYVAIGEVKDDSSYSVDTRRTFEFKERYERYPEKRKSVEWLRVVSKSEFLMVVGKTRFSQQTLTRIATSSDEASKIESLISETFILENKAHLVLKVSKETDINAYDFRDFLNGLTYFFEELNEELGVRKQEDLNLKISVESPGLIAAASLGVAAVLGIGVLVSNKAKIKLKIKDQVDLDLDSGDSILKPISDFLDRKQERKIEYNKFCASQDRMELGVYKSKDKAKKIEKKIEENKKDESSQNEDEN